MRKILLTLLILTASSWGFASEEEAENWTPVQVAYQQWFNLLGNRGQVHVLLHHEGHANGLPSVVELRSNCRSREVKWKAIEAENVLSQCYLEPKTIKFNAETEQVTVEGYEKDYDAYQANLAKDPPDTTPSCDLKHKKTFVLSTKDLCQHKKKKSGR